LAGSHIFYLFAIANLLKRRVKMVTRYKKRLPPKLLILLISLGILVLTSLFAGRKAYNIFFAPNVQTIDDSPAEVFIPSSPTFDEVVWLLRHSGAIKNIESFKIVSKLKGYNTRPRGGRYLLHNGINNRELVGMLRSGRQTPVNVTFSNIRLPEELAGHLSARLEPDSLSFLKVFNDREFLASLGVEPHTLFGIILPNTYQMFWTSTPQEFLERMHRESERFWTHERLGKAEEAGLTPLEVVTLASIVDEETIREDEKPMVAGLYINRLNRGMHLQADPTVRFAMGDFTVNRILRRDLLIDSPYNTYLHVGLPPGPIRMPSISGIEAVLNYEKHDYIFMCAKYDFSGYHAFARTLREHNRNAARYRQALNRLQIFR